MKKEILTITLAGIMCLAMAGCNNSQDKPSDSQNAGTVTSETDQNPAAIEQDTDDDNDMNTENMISVEDLKSGEYKVVNEANTVLVMHNTGSYFETYSYVFTDGKLSAIDTVYKYPDADVASKSYEALKNNKEQYNSYGTIVLEGNNIKFTAKQSQIDALKSVTQDELYKKQKEAHPESK